MIWQHRCTRFSVARAAMSSARPVRRRLPHQVGHAIFASFMFSRYALNTSTKYRAMSPDLLEIPVHLVVQLREPVCDVDGEAEAILRERARGENGHEGRAM
jgi:hypothetical protein